MNMRMILTGLGAIVAAYLAGRFSAPAKIETSLETSSVIAENVSLRAELAEAREKLSQSEKTVVTVKRELPDGTKVTRSRTVAKRSSSERSELKSLSNLVASKDSATKSEEKTITESRRGVSVSALVGVPLDSLAKVVVWGASFQKQFIGPLILGAWAFTDLRFGLSVGVEL